MNWLQLLLPLFGVIIGAVMQFVLSRRSESQKQLQVLRSQAYADYLKTISACAHRLPDAKFNAADAKARLAIFGSAEVLRALAKFEQIGPALDNPSSNQAFLAVVSAMRAKRGREVSAGDLSVVLLGPNCPLK